MIGSLIPRKKQLGKLPKLTQQEPKGNRRKMEDRNQKYFVNFRNCVLILNLIGSVAMFFRLLMKSEDGEEEK